VWKFKVASAFVVLGLIWGGAFVAIKVVVQEIPPFHSVMFRLLLATPYLWLLFRLTKKPMYVPPVALPRVAIAGLTMIAIPFCLVFWGETRISAGVAGIINGMVPLWTVIMSLVAFWGVNPKRSSLLSVRLCLGLAMGFAGLMIIFWPQVSFDELSRAAWGTLAVVGMAFCYGFANVMNARLMRAEQGITLAGNVFYQHLVSAIFLVAIVPFVEPVSIDWSALLQPKVAGALLYLSFVSGATAQIFYYFLIQEIGPIKTSAITYLIPVASLLLDFWILSEMPSWSVLAGAGFILTALFFIRSSEQK
jgi:drug/metabolite transporter (DMT)-like permease